MPVECVPDPKADPCLKITVFHQTHYIFSERRSQIKIHRAAIPQFRLLHFDFLFEVELSAIRYPLYAALFTLLRIA
jgi:hypothetical protein